MYVCLNLAFCFLKEPIARRQFVYAVRRRESSKINSSLTLMKGLKREEVGQKEISAFESLSSTALR